MSAQTIASLLVRLGMNTAEFDKGMQSAQESTGALEKGFDTLQTGGKWAMGLAAGGLLALGAGAVAVGTKAFKAGSSFDTAMSFIAAGTGKTGEGLDALGDVAKNVFGDVPQDMETVGLAVAELNTRLGAEGELLEDVTKSALDFARVHRLDVTTSIGTLGKVLNALEMEASEAEGAMDKFTMGAQMSGIGVDNLMNYIIDAGPSFEMLGYGLDESIALFSAFEASGARPEEVISSLGRAMNYMVDEGIEPSAEAFQGLIHEMQHAEDYSESLTMANEMFGRMVGDKVVEDIRAGRFEIDEWTQQIASAEGTLESTAAESLTFAERVSMMWDKVTLAVLPLGEAFITIGEKIMDVAMPAFENLLDTVMPILENLGDALVAFVDGLIAGEDPLLLIEALLGDVFGPDIAEQVMDIVNNVISLAKTVWDFMGPVLEWVAQFVKLEDIIIAVSIAILAFAIPALVGLLLPVIKVIAIIAAVVAIVAILRNAWENDWLGIRSALEEAWENLQPVFEALQAWLAVAIPQAVNIVKSFWEGRLQPAFQAVGSFLSGTVFPIFQAVAGFMQGAFTVAGQVLANIWQNVLQPAIKAVWEFLQNSVFPLFQAVAGFMDVAFSLALTALAGLWQNVLQPALQTAYEWLAEKLQPAFEVLVDLWENTLLPVIQTVTEWIGEKLVAGFDSLGGVIDKATGWIKGLTDTLGGISLPGWLTPGSPTPFETGLVGINKALRSLNTTLPTFEARVDIDDPGLLEAGVEGGGRVIKNYNLTMPTTADPNDVGMAFELMEAIGGH